MPTHLDKEDIITQSGKTFSLLTEYCSGISDDLFFQQPANKWSVAQNVAHLVISTKSATLPYILPKFIVKLIVGKPNRPSRSYEELVDKYKKKLADGGKAGSRFVPAPVNASVGKKAVLLQWEKITSRYLQTIKKYCTNGQLDQYIIPHPLLGKITLRELCYFTIYHTEHHLAIIKSLR